MTSRPSLFGDDMTPRSDKNADGVEGILFFQDLRQRRIL